MFPKNFWDKLRKYNILYTLHYIFFIFFLLRDMFEQRDLTISFYGFSPLKNKFKVTTWANFTSKKNP